MKTSRASLITAGICLVLLTGLGFLMVAVARYELHAKYKQVESAERAYTLAVEDLRTGTHRCNGSPMLPHENCVQFFAVEGQSTILRIVLTYEETAPSTEAVEVSQQNLLAARKAKIAQCTRYRQGAWAGGGTGLIILASLALSAVFYARRRAA